MIHWDWVVAYFGGLLGFIAYGVVMIGKKLDRIIELLERDKR